MKHVFCLLLFLMSLNAMAQNQVHANMLVSLTIVDTCSVNSTQNPSVKCNYDTAYKINKTPLSSSLNTALKKQNTQEQIITIEF